MAKSNRDRVGEALDLLKEGLEPFVEQTLKGKYKDLWVEKVSEWLRENPALRRALDGGNVKWDVPSLIGVINNGQAWRYVFNNSLGKAERAMLGEALDVRNRHAHQDAFGTDDSIRALDTIHRLMLAISAPQASDVDRLKQEVMRIRFSEMARRETQKATRQSLQGEPLSGLRPWREIVTPHPDVASGRYAQAEFAADLAQVFRGDASSEYADPKEFYRRTYITEGIERLLVTALRRLNGRGGDPVIELQTNFGGGKTHSMLALYHLCSGVAAGDLPGLDDLLPKAEVEGMPDKVSRAVLVGTALSPGQPRKKPDGIEVRTLWGELAWQLLKKKGYAFVAESDQAGVSPGSDVLVDLLKTAGPTLILIDEWVAYLRQLYEVAGLPGGSFDANLTFAQSLTEAMKSAPQAMLVATLPQSAIEIGGQGGKEALARLENTFARVESSWRPASQEESYEIVRRRLFEPIEAELYPSRDAVVRAFGELYRRESGEFPSECREGEYERRVEASYPIHPELFDRLYSDWSSLEEFQRTRGVLRLMAAVIHTLWSRDDRSLMILPSMVPMDEPTVKDELARYLPPNWQPVVEKDVDGPHSLPLKLDHENAPNLGRYSATRRVARTIFVGSAPTAGTARRGIDDRHVKLGCVQPGERPPVFGDALRRLTDQATHLYVDGTRYWYSTQPTVTRLAQDRAAQQSDDDVIDEIKRRLKEERTHRAEFSRVHDCPSGSNEVPDEMDARLVILSPEMPHINGNEQSAALTAAKEILENRGSSQRYYRNALVFLTADLARLSDLNKAVRQYLAWKSIHEDRTTLNLDPFQAGQAKTQFDQANETVNGRIPETYQWMLVPEQRAAISPIAWRSIRLQGADHLAVRASKRLINDELLLNRFAGTRLRLELDRIPLWRGEHVPVKQLVEDFAQYLYLPRLKHSRMLLDAIAEGIGLLTWVQDGFAYADSWVEQQSRYIGLKAGVAGGVIISAEGGSVLVKPEAARRQIDQEAESALQPNGTGGTATATEPTGESETPRLDGHRVTPLVSRSTRFVASTHLDPTRVGRDAAKIAEAVIQHLAGLPNSDVEVTLSIEATLNEGVDERVRRTVSENCATLRFRDFDFIAND